MSISAVNGVSQIAPQAAPGVTAIPAATSFTQELDSAQAGGAHSHHHHHGGATQSVTSSASTAASVAGVTSPSTLGSALVGLLS